MAMIFIILSCLTIVKADISHDVYIGGVKQTKEILIENVNLTWPFSLALDDVTNNLYYVDNLQPAILNLNTREHKYIDGVSDATSVAVDQETHYVYISHRDGIYKYKPGSNVIEIYGATGHYIWRVYFKGILYYTEYWSERAFAFVNGHPYMLVNMQSETSGFVIDKEGVVFFKNRTGLYSQQRGSNEVTLYFKEKLVYNVALDRNDRVYFCARDGIYEAIKYTGSTRKIVWIKDYVLNIIFDQNNDMIFSTKHKIYRIPDHRRNAEVKSPADENETTKSCKEVTDQLKGQVASMNRTINDLLQRN